ASAGEWQPCRVRGEGERVVAVDAFTDFAVVTLRSHGLTALRILTYDATGPAVFGAGWDVVPDEDLYTIGLGANLESATRRLQVVVESMVTPHSIYDYDVDERTWTLLKRQPVLGGYDPGAYRQHRAWVTASDGTRVPVSVVHRADVAPDGTNPGWLYGYGAYEASMDPYFSVARLSMLDRGVVCAVAHVRGGGEMGRSWYDAGRLMAKNTTFTDFLAAADLLVDQGWVAADRLVAEGGSAGGLLIGAAVNLAPHRFAAVHAAVPFVDPLTTILDPSLPLTVTEWEEWGDPLHDPDVYRYLKSYAPYENIAAAPYPAILATTSLHDTRVHVVEPAKWVARLRAVTVTDESRRPILLKTEMEGGHGGRSGRYDAWRQAAFELAFLLDAVGAVDIVDARA
ncbi:MAG TPA: prolyl oligopeptidase family serine peptidase, partial [Candidatus Lustribacter sp.]|nr:prolyl oligopeptidase family serine peptidase [Candidatus Lustribacter sp.]